MAMCILYILCDFCLINGRKELCLSLIKLRKKDINIFFIFEYSTDLQ